MVIDPSYTYEQGAYGVSIIDTMVHAGDTSTNCSCGQNHDTYERMIAGIKNSKKYYAFFKFNTISGYGLSRINSASIKLHLTDTTSSGGPYSLYRVNQSWDESITFAKQKNYSTTLIQSNVPYVENSNGTVTATFDVTSQIRDVIVGKYENYGYKLAYTNESTNDYNNFHTIDFATVSYRPMLTINYDMDLPAGTFYLNNVEKYTFLGAAYGQENAFATKYDAAGSSAAEYANAGLEWKVSNNSYYDGYSIIRPAYETGYALYSDSSGNVKLGMLSSTAGSSAEDNYEWNIVEYGTDRYVVVNRMYQTALMINSSGVRAVKYAGSSASMWRMMTPSEYKPRKNTTQHIYNKSIGGTVSYDDIPREGGTFSGDDNSYTYTLYTGGAVSFGAYYLTVTGYGVARMVFQYKDTTAQVTVYVLSSEYPSVYFMQNVKSGMYMDVAAAANGTVVEQYAFDGGTTQKWQFELQTDGSYMIKNVETGTYLTITSLSGYYPAILTARQSGNSSQRFYIETDLNGNVTIYPKYGEASNAILAAQTVSSGAYIGQGSTTSDNRDKWDFVPCGLKDAALIALPETTNRSSYFPNIVESLNELGFEEVYQNHSSINAGITKEELLYHISNSKIILIRTHGSEEYIVTSDGNLTISDIEALDGSYFDNTELVILGTCSTGEGGTVNSNFARALYLAGVETVIGFKYSVNRFACNNWCKEFFNAWAAQPDMEIAEICNEAYYYVCNNAKEESNILTESYDMGDAAAFEYPTIFGNTLPSA